MKSIQAARRIIEAKDNAAALQGAEAAALKLWRDHKLAPKGLPRPKAGDQPVNVGDQAGDQAGGVVVLNPW